MRSCEQAQNGGWQRGKSTRDIRWRTGAGKRGRGSWLSQESLHTGCFGYRYFANSSSRIKTLRVDTQPQTTKVFYHLRLRCVGGLSPPTGGSPATGQQESKKSSQCYIYTSLPFQVPFFITTGIWGGVLIPMSKSWKQFSQGCCSSRSTLCFNQTEEQKEKNRQVASPLVSESAQAPVTKNEGWNCFWEDVCTELGLCCCLCVIWISAFFTWPDICKANDKAGNKWGNTFLNILIWTSQIW